MRSPPSDECVTSWITMDVLDKETTTIVIIIINLLVCAQCIEL